MRIKYGAQAVPGGGLITNQSNIVSVYLHEGDALLDNGIDTDAEGFWEYTWTPTGSAAAGWVLKPGPLYWVLSYLGAVRRGSTKAGGLVGPNSLLEFPEFMPVYGDYVVTGAITGDFAVSIGALMTVVTAAGYAVVRGVGVDNTANRTLNIATAHATLPRIDTVVLELTRTAGDTEGKAVLKVVSGTAAASPVAPTLTQNTTTWQYPLSDVRSNAAVSTPTSVTDRRTYPTTSITRSPTQNPTLILTQGAVSLPSSPTAVAGLEHSITLVSSKWYDIFIETEVDIITSSGSAVIACYIEGTSNAGTSRSWAGVSLRSLSNAHTRSVLGTGAAISCGVLVSISGGGSGSYYSGRTTVLAVPRS